MSVCGAKAEALSGNNGSSEVQTHAEQTQLPITMYGHYQLIHHEGPHKLCMQMQVMQFLSAVFQLRQEEAKRQPTKGSLPNKHEENCLSRPSRKSVSFLNQAQ